MLNPLISSLSPSIRSNGARLHSISERVIQIINQVLLISSKEEKYVLIVKVDKTVNIIINTRIIATS